VLFCTFRYRTAAHRHLMEAVTAQPDVRWTTSHRPIRMPELLSRWPVWYLAIAGYVSLLGVLGAISVHANRAAYTEALAAASAPRDRGRIYGLRTGALLKAVTWMLGGILLLSGWMWVQVGIALLLLQGLPRRVRDFARGMAEGRTSVELAAAIEYVENRVSPRPLDWGAAVAIFGVLRVLPAIALLFAWRLRSG